MQIIKGIDGDVVLDHLKMQVAGTASLGDGRGAHRPQDGPGRDLIPHLDTYRFRQVGNW